MIEGDFNELYCINNKKGGLRVSFDRLNRLNNFYFRNKMENIVNLRYKYFWSSRYSKGLFLERLDRGLVR